MKNKIIIATSPRTGSTLLMDSLASHPQARSIGEYYNKNYRNNEYLNNFNLTKVFSIDIDKDGYEELIKSADFIIFLYRKDKFTQLLSWKRACRTGKWTDSIIGPIFPEEQAKMYYIDLAEKLYTPIADLFICYEDMIDNWHETIQKILKAVGWQEIKLEQKRKKIKRELLKTEIKMKDPCINSFNNEELNFATYPQKLFKSANVDERLALEMDTRPIPKDIDRELYNPGDDKGYWLSGLNEAKLALEEIKKHKKIINKILDFGCASGRIARHFAYYKNLDVYGCDLNYKHIRWICRYLPKVKAFQNTPNPHLPYESNTFDAITAFSVFTHIDHLDTAWLMELRRILRPGGVAYLTFHSEITLAKMPKDHILYKYISQHQHFHENVLKHPMLVNKIFYRNDPDNAYATHSFYNSAYVREVWGSIMSIQDIQIRFPEEQDLVVLTK